MSAKPIRIKRESKVKRRLRYETLVKIKGMYAVCVGLTDAEMQELNKLIALTYEASK